MISEAAEWLLLSALLARPTDHGKQDVRRLAAEIQHPALTHAADQFHEAREGVYLSQLGPGGPVSPREVTYRGSRDPGVILSDLRAFYDAFSYQPKLEDPPDHISVESGFVGFLLLKALYAQFSQSPCDSRTTLEASVSFVQSHLSGFIEPFGERLLRVGGEGYLVETATLLSAKVSDLASQTVHLETG